MCCVRMHCSCHGNSQTVILNLKNAALFPSVYTHYNTIKWHFNVHFNTHTHVNNKLYAVQTNNIIFLWPKFNVGGHTKFWTGFANRYTVVPVNMGLSRGVTVFNVKGVRHGYNRKRRGREKCPFFDLTGLHASVLENKMPQAWIKVCFYT